jgi:hypothetical protein
MRIKIFSFSTTKSGLIVMAAMAMMFSTMAHATTWIYGTPGGNATAERWYAFQAWAKDNDHRSVTYSIKNKPGWASFDTRYGHLYGVPPDASVGTYSGITITASDGVSSASLPPFSIIVHPLKSGGSGSPPPPPSPTTGSATLNWMPPLANTDGSTLTDLAGYVIHYGTNASQLTSTVKITNPGLTSYVLQNLVAGTYYFGVMAYDATGQSSVMSTIVSKTIK